MARLLARLVEAPSDCRWLGREEVRALRSAGPAELAELRAKASRYCFSSWLPATLMLVAARDPAAGSLLADLLDNYRYPAELARRLRLLDDVYAEHADLVGPWLTGMLDSPDADVRSDAAWTCRCLRVAGVGPRLLELAAGGGRDGDRFLHAAAACWPGPEVTAAVRRRLPRPYQRGSIGVEGALAELVSGAAGADQAWAVRAAVAELAAGRCGFPPAIVEALASAGPAGIAALGELASDADTPEPVRRDVREALAGGVRGGPLEEWTAVGAALIAAGLASPQAVGEAVALSQPEREELVNVRRPSRVNLAKALLRFDGAAVCVGLEGDGSGIPDYACVVEEFTAVTDGAVGVWDVRLVSTHTAEDGTREEQDPHTDRDLDSETELALSFYCGAEEFTIPANVNHGWYDTGRLDAIAAVLLPSDPIDRRRFVRLVDPAGEQASYVFTDPAALDTLLASSGIQLAAPRR